jgi:hypothetical protein
MARRFALAAFWAALIFAFVMAIVPQPPEVPGDPSDKVLHMIAFAVLTGLAAAAYPRANPLRILLGLAAFGATIEIVQAIPALNRDSEWIDLVADIGAMLAAQAAVTLIRRLGAGR